MKPSVYIETSVVGHLTSRIPDDTIVAGQMLATRRWWNERRQDFDLFISEAVVAECSQGDPNAARERLDVIAGLPALPMTEPGREFSQLLLTRHALPMKARVDAIHIALAAINAIEYVLTWNCRHIANATLRSKIEATCRECGYNPPILCTPYELLEVIN